MHMPREAVGVRLVDVQAAGAADDFIRRVVAMQAAWTAAGDDGLARVPSRTHKRMVTLLWSRRSQAERQGAELINHHLQVKPLSLKELYVDVLPKLTQLGRSVALDRTGDAVHEVDPALLARQLREEAVALFRRKVNAAGALFILQGTDGPAFVMSKHTAGTQVLPCWHDRASAQARIAGPLEDTVVAEVSLADFRDKLLPRLSETKRGVAPAYCEGDGVLEFAAGDVRAWFSHSPADTLAVAATAA
jgi:hypothetical protein